MYGEKLMIVLNHLKKEYPMDGYVVSALTDVSLSLPQKGFVGIVGPSGCGKTTLLNILGGLDHQTEGLVMIDEVNTSDFNDSMWNSYRNQSVGFVFQSFYLIPHLTLLENVMLPIKFAGKSFDEQVERATKVLNRVGLSDKLFAKPNQCSGGQQQRAAIARALVLEPKIILADEPTGSLDHESSISIMEILKEASQERLVLMVTHNEKLAENYFNRIIRMDQGKIVDDVNKSGHDEIESIATPIYASKMSFLTSFKLSYLNLKKRFYRTLLIILAASIGMMGITLVLAVASGFDQFIELRKTETLNAFPIRVEKISVVIPFFDEKYKPSLPAFSDDEIVYPRNIQYEFQTVNTLTPAYFAHVQGLDQNLYTHIHYDYGINSSFGVKNGNNYVNPEDAINELDINKAYLAENFDLLYGELPDDQQMEAVFIVDRYNRLSKDIAQYLGFSGNEPITFDDLTSINLKWLPNNLVYTLSGTNYIERPLENIYDSEDAHEISIVGVVRIKEKFNLDYLRSGLYYTSFVGETMRSDAALSDIVLAQKNSNTSVLDGSSLTQTQKESLLRDLGHSTYPVGYTIYSSTFDDKDAIMRYLRSYNDQVSINDAIEPLDIAGIGLSTMRVAIDSTTTVLLVFSGISLLISNIMISIMTYTSVIERTKEIGILRAIGARKHDVGNIFYAETLLIGLASGIVGVVLSYLLMPLFNIILNDITSIPSLTRLHPLIGLGLILMSMILTSLAGIIPAKIASNKDPILCLRNE